MASKVKKCDKIFMRDFVTDLETVAEKMSIISTCPDRIRYMIILITNTKLGEGYSSVCHVRTAKEKSIKS